MQQKESTCSGKNSKCNKACSFKGKHIFEGQRYCGVHLPVGECPICIDHMTNRNSVKTSCNHLLHVDCLRKWLYKGSSTCPMCRQPLSDTEIERIAPKSLINPKSFVLSLHDINFAEMDHYTAVEYLRNILSQGIHEPQSQTNSSNTSLFGNILYTVTLLN